MNKGNLNKSYTGLRQDLLNHIDGNNLTVLDVGCAIGSNGRYLIEQKIANKVDGIEFDQEMALVAEEFYDEVFVEDLNKDISSFLDGFKGKEAYDVIIFGDILEHLINPKEILSSFQEKLKSTGLIIISVPNISHLELFIQIYLKGSFPRNKRGIFDSTHLRWYTKNDILNLVNDIGCFKNIQYFANYRLRDKIGSRSKFRLNILKILLPSLVTFQHILVCEKK